MLYKLCNTFNVFDTSMVSSGNEVILPFHKALIIRFPLPKRGLCWLCLIVQALGNSQDLFNLIWNGVIKLTISIFFCIIEQILMMDLMLCLNLVFLAFSFIFWQPVFCHSALGTFEYAIYCWACGGKKIVIWEWPHEWLFKQDTIVWTGPTNPCRTALFHSKFKVSII